MKTWMMRIACARVISNDREEQAKKAKQGR
jgi:hypothetical protein